MFNFFSLAIKIELDLLILNGGVIKTGEVFAFCHFPLFGEEVKLPFLFVLNVLEIGLLVLIVFDHLSLLFLLRVDLILLAYLVHCAEEELLELLLVLLGRFCLGGY